MERSPKTYKEHVSSIVFPDNSQLAKQVQTNIVDIASNDIEIKRSDLDFFPNDDKYAAVFLLKVLGIKNKEFTSSLKYRQEDDGSIAYTQITFFDEKLTSTIKISGGKIFLDRNEDAALVTRVLRKFNAILDYPSNWQNFMKKLLANEEWQSIFLTSVSKFTKILQQSSFPLTRFEI